MHAAMKVFSTFLFDTKKTVAAIEIKQGLLSKSNTELLAFARWKRVKGTRSGRGFIKTLSTTYLSVVLYAANSTVLYCGEVSDLIPPTTEVQRSWQRRCEVINELGVPREDETFLADGSLVQLVFLAYTVYALHLGP